MPDRLGMCHTEDCLYQANLGLSRWCPVCRPSDYTNRLTPTPTYAHDLDPEPWA